MKTASRPSRVHVLTAPLCVLLLASVLLIACGRSDQSYSGEADLVWEAWSVVKSSYVEADELDSEAVTGTMITSMLEASEIPQYPFLTEMESVRGSSVRGVPVELVDVWKAWSLIRLKSPEVQTSLLSSAAIAGMLVSLGDDSVAHLTPEAYQRATQRTTGPYGGIGAYVSVEAGRVVVSPMPDSPAERAGLQDGDVVLEADGQRLGDEGLESVVAMVRGEPGTSLSLLVERAGEPEPIEVRVVRGDIQVGSVDRSLLPGAIGYVIITDFRENTGEELLTALEELKQFDMLALILELRNNLGDSVESARAVASQFIPDGLVMFEIDNGGKRTDWTVNTGGIATEDLPMVVLVNELTASAAEVVAGALQDAERAKVMGTDTLGKGSASEFEELSDGSALYLPVTHWYTPTGSLIQGNGIAPDIELGIIPEDRAAGVDSQLLGAYNYLNEILAETIPFR